VLDVSDWEPGNPAPVWGRPDVAALARWLRAEAFRGVVVMIGGLEPDEREEVYHFCRALNVPVVAEATSGLRESLAELSIFDADRMLKQRPPGKVLRLGEVPSGRFWRDLEALPDVQVWSVCRNGLPGLARASEVSRGPVDRVLKALGQVDPLDDALDYWVGASGRAARIDELLEAYPDSEPGMLRMLSNYASVGSGVFLGNSMPIREWNDFAQWQREVTQVRANRGANGIDGQISTWLGCSADLTDAWAVVGDLTALYDLAAPFVLKQIEPAGRVLAVIHNGGGGIFSRLPRLAAMHPRAAECMTNPHDADLAGFAAIWDMRYVRISRVDDFDAFEPGDRPMLLEVRPDPEQTRQFWQAWDRLVPGKS
jgi:2-succinyl-5-enolpyruvyl-6-hydroxy-3-cyclohexene-1-carboxylate synthase